MTAFLHVVHAHFSPKKVSDSFFTQRNQCSSRIVQKQNANNDTHRHGDRMPNISVMKFSSSDIVKQTFCSLSLAVLISLSGSIVTPELLLAEVTSKPECIQGEGPGCAENASENGYIAKLLQKSRENREKTQQEVLEKYWKQGYGDYFSFGYNKELVKGPDGKWSLKDPENPFLAAKKRIDSILPKDKDSTK